MKMHKKQRIRNRIFAFLMAAALICPDVGGPLQAQAAGTGTIPISGREDLEKIGRDSAFPMDGDYELTADIDLSDGDWIPIGGAYVGNKGTCDPDTDKNVFSGTFDGKGHVISGLTMNLADSVAQDGKYGQAGFFSVIGSKDASDRAEVRDLIFRDVKIQTDFPDGLSAVGTLAGEVNGYAEVSGIAVLSGKLLVNRSGKSDTVGAGGIVGECRTENAAIGNGHISITDCYNGADMIAGGSRGDLIYASGIIGRIAKSACGSVARCVNTGSIQYEGYDANGIAYAEGGNAAYLANVENCYFLKTSGFETCEGTVPLSESKLKGGKLPDGLSADVWTAEEGCYPYPSICYASGIAGELYLSGLSLGFADGESSAGVKTEIALPQELNGSGIEWTSSDPAILTVEAGKAVAHPDAIGTNASVVLTAEVDGHSREFRVTVLTSLEQVASFSKGYAQVGEKLTVSVSNTEGTALSYQWEIDGETVSETDSYTPIKADLEKFISVTVRAEGGLSWNLRTYCSELPVVYVETEDGQEVTSNSVAKDAHIRVQGNAEFDDESYWYDGATTIKGRGNSTWYEAVSWGVKKPYKLKLDSKANLLGLGKTGKGTNKHWCLLANMIDHTNMRNQIVNKFSRDIGMEYSMGGTSVVLILNGEYQGLYELCEHVRIGGSRIDVLDWEELADDIADAICKKEESLKKSDMEDAMEQDYHWVTSGNFTYKGTTYQISDYYEEEIPEFTGGFLLDMDFRSTSDQYKYISTFSTSNGIPMFFRSPEYAKTNPVMVDYARDYVNAYEAALKSPDYTTTYQDKTVHYTDLLDLDSLVQYWMVCEFTNNWDSMKNSTYMYKDLEGKAKMGPAWDYDWAFGNINMYSMTGPFVYDNWHTTLTGMPTGEGGFCEQSYQAEQWNRYLVRDPYFVTKAYEYYKKYRPTVIEDIIKDGGEIDAWEKKYQTAADANDAKWGYSYGNCSGFAFINGKQEQTQSQTYNAAVASMKTFIKKRMEWMDGQTSSVAALYKSLGNSVDGQIAVSLGKDASGKVVAVADVKDSSVKYVSFLINGKKIETADGAFIPVTDGRAMATLEDGLLEEEALNAVEAIGANSSKSYMSGKMNFVSMAGKDVKDGIPEQEIKTLEGNVSIQSDSGAEGKSYPGNTLTAKVEGSNNSGTLAYQWYAGDTAISGADKASYKLTANEIGKKISVKVTSSVEAGELTGMYGGTVEKEPGTDNPSDPGSTDNPSNPGGTDNPTNPGGTDNPSNPGGTDNPTNPGGTDSPSEPGVPLAKSVKLSVSSKTLQVYGTLQLKASVTPAEASQKVIWLSSKPAVAGVSQSGKVTAKSAGKAVITVQAIDGGGAKATCRITVQKPSLKVSGKTSVKRRKSITMTASAKGLKGKISWKLDAKGKKILKLSKSKGSKVKLTAKAKTGTAKLTVSCGGRKVVKKIKVKK